MKSTAAGVVFVDDVKSVAHRKKACLVRSLTFVVVGFTYMLLIAGFLIGATECAAESPLALSPASSKVLPSQTIDFHALIGAAAQDFTAHVQTWTSSNPAVASISSTGHLTALTPGTTTITAGIGALQASAHVTVLDLCLMSLPGNEAVCKTIPGQCKDSDGDGLSDAWEMAGGIDFNGDGVVDESEKVLTNVDPVFPDGTTNLHPSAEPGVKDVFVLYDWMELPDQLTNGQPTACTVNPLPSGPPNFLNLFYPYHSDQCAFDQHCVNGYCRGHSDAPSPAALMMVIEAFARRDIRLHLLKGHALPHSNVVSFEPPVAACTADLSSQTFSGGQAVDFYQLKAANFNASYNSQNFTSAQLTPFMHYAVFGHRHSCDTVHDCAQAACINPDTGRNPLFNETGLAEQPGNDLIVSEGGFRDRLIEPLTLAQGGTFMHELGHNLGLNHGGPLFVAGEHTDFNQVKLNYKPNYLSVMNYNHQSLGISTASPNCPADDYVCKTTPVSVRLDYSSFTNGEAPNTLDENSGSESDGISVGNNDIGYTWCSGVQTPIPGTGRVDLNCNGNRTETWCASGCDITPGLELNKDPAGGGQIPNGTPGSGDVLLPFEDWPNLIFAFQCQGTFNDGAVAMVGYGKSLSSGEMTTDQIMQQSSVPDSGLAACGRDRIPNKSCGRKRSLRSCDGVRNAQRTIVGYK